MLAVARAAQVASPPLQRLRLGAGGEAQPRCNPWRGHTGECAMTDHNLILQFILEESRNATADCLGGSHASLADAREGYIAGMIELAGLLGLPQDFMEALDMHRWALIDAARRR